MTDWEQDVINFWKHIKPDDNRLLEIRVTGNLDQAYHNNMQSFRFHTGVYTKNNVQLFISNLKHLLEFLKFRNEYFRKNFKICYGLNLREAKNGTISGGYEHTPKNRFVYFDLDFDRVEKEEFFKSHVLPFTKYLERYGLKKPLLVDSGGGFHVLYKINEVNITDGRKRWYKEFVTNISRKFTDDIMTVDTLYDFTRIFALPGTVNVKRNAPVKLLTNNKTKGYIDNHEFTFHTKRMKKQKSDANPILAKDTPEIRESLEYVTLLHEPPEGDRHQKLVFALKLLLKLKGYTKETVREFENELAQLYGRVDLNPLNGTKDKTYHPGILINWCKENISWVKENPEVHKKFNEQFKK